MNTKFKYTAVKVVITLLVIFIIAIQVAIHATGAYTMVEVMDVSPGNKMGLRVKYRAKIDNKYVNLSKVGVVAYKPHVGQYLVIKYLRFAPSYNWLLYNKPVPHCFKFGQSYESLECVYQD